MKLKNPTLEEIAKNINRVLGMSLKQQENLWKNTLRTYQKKINEKSFPELMDSKKTIKIMDKIMHDRGLCKDAGIKYPQADKHGYDIKAAVALFYYDQMIGS